MKSLKRTVKKISITVGIVAALAFITYNIAFFHQRNQLKHYASGFQTILKNKNYLADESNQGYIYNVKYPSYFSLTGNLTAATKDNHYALLIWPKITGETKVSFQKNSLAANENADSTDYLTVKDGKVTFTGKHFSEKERQQIRQLEKQAKQKWGADIIG